MLEPDVEQVEVSATDWFPLILLVVFFVPLSSLSSFGFSNAN